MLIPLIESDPVAVVPQAGAVDSAFLLGVKALVLDSVSSPKTKLLYGAALDRFLSWFQGQGEPLSKALVQRYRAELEGKGLAPSTINVQLAAIRKLVTEASDNGLLSSDVAGAVSRVKGIKRLGVKLGNWLNEGQANELLNKPPADTLKGKRDRAMLAIMLGAGLRRSEVAGLTVGHLQQREGRWVIVDMVGKGGRVRSVPIASWIKAAIDRWTTAASITDGFVFRPVNKGDHLCGESMTDQAVYNTLATYSGGELAPHDMRRTFAQLARKEDCPIEQIQQTLGHASIQTTERYLGTKQDLQNSPSDRLKLKFEQ